MKYNNYQLIIFVISFSLLITDKVNSAGPISGDSARVCLENFRDNFSGNFIDFTYGVVPIPADRRLDTEFLTSLGVTFSTHQNRFLNPINPPHNTYVSNIAPNQIIGTPCIGCSDDGRYPYQIEFSSPQQYAGILRNWESTTRTKFYNANAVLLHEAIGSDFYGFLATTTDINTWISRIEITGVLDSSNNRQVGYSDDLFFGTVVPVSMLQITASVGVNGTLDSTLKSPDACGITQFIVTANTGYTTDSSVGGTCPTGTWVDDTYTLNSVIANCNISFTQTINTYSITPSASLNGSILPNSIQLVNHGETTQFSITPDFGYFSIINSTCGGSLTDNVFTTNTIINDCFVGVDFLLIELFKNGFESITVSKFLQSIQQINKNNNYPQYYPNTNSINFYGYNLIIGEIANSDLLMSIIHEWIVEVLANENPLGDFDHDGIKNKNDKNITEILKIKN